MLNSSSSKLVTICIATFNRSSRVAQLIQEILDFNLNDKIEILVIDDGSSDDTFEVISEFSKFKNSLDFEILELKPHEQFEFKYSKEAPTGCDYGIGG